MVYNPQPADRSLPARTRTGEHFHGATRRMRADSIRRVYQVDAFTRTAYEGNPAGVVLDADGLDATQMQRIARELNNSETAFVQSPKGTDHDVHIRFFTPTVEVPVCGHATVAAHYVLAREGRRRLPSLRQLTGVGVQSVDTELMDDGSIRIWIQQNAPKFGKRLGGTHLAALVGALGIELEHLLDVPPQIVSTGHSKVMVPLGSRDVLNRLSPDLAALAALSARIGCNGFYPFALTDSDPLVLAHGRMFAPAIGINEDPVTGNANGPLGAYLVQHRLIPHEQVRQGLRAWMRQGEAMGRPGQVRVEVEVDARGREPVSVRIGGDAVIVFSAEIEA